MIDDDLLSVLACPETKKNLQLIDARLIAQINDKIIKGEILTKLKVKVDEPIEGGLMREGDESCIYPIRHNIPVLLVEELISITNV